MRGYKLSSKLGKCHFMVNEGIVFGHKIFERGIEVDKANIEAIERMPYPRDIIGIQGFLSHAGFYKRFIKDFSKSSRPSLIFSRRMFLFYLMKIVRRPSKFLRKP